MPCGYRGWQFVEKPDTRGYSEPLQEPYEIAPGDSQWGQFCSAPTTREEVAFRFEVIVRSSSKTLKNIWRALPSLGSLEMLIAVGPRHDPRRIRRVLRIRRLKILRRYVPRRLHVPRIHRRLKIFR